jgi:alpha-L-fucosidase
MLEARPTTGDTSWFTHDRFGLFIHWGLYALPARHEWVKSREQLPDAHYDRYFKVFDPDLYDPDAWADAAAGAGMKYFVVTSKHHEGFCLWDSDLTEYKSTRTPCGRDLLQPMVSAFRERGMRVGFYHSLIDWHHPDFVVDTKNHPQRRGDLAALNAERDQMRYAEYLHGQTRELLTRFGHIDIMWFDFSYPDPDDPTDFAKGKNRDAWRARELVKLVRELQPHVVLNDRLDLADVPEAWDVKTPEQFQPRHWFTVNDQPVVWEACQTFSGSWGYYRDEHSWRSTEQLIHTLIDCVSKGGNLLLNVGPTGRGEFDERAVQRLAGIGQWMRRHQRSIYGCTQAPDEFVPPEHSRLTYCPQSRRLYVHLFAWPYQYVHLEGAYCRQVEYAQLLHDASEVQMETPPAWMLGQAGAEGKADLGTLLTLKLPLTQPDVVVPVIELFLKAPG